MGLRRGEDRPRRDPAKTRSLAEFPGSPRDCHSSSPADASRTDESSTPWLADRMTSWTARSPERLSVRPCSARACHSIHSNRDMYFPQVNGARVETIHDDPKYDSILTQ